MSKTEMVDGKADKAKPTLPTPCGDAPVKASKPTEEVVFTEEDKTLLEEKESAIKTNIGAFLVIGEALSVIKRRDLQKIVRADLTFDEYCIEMWGFGKAYAYRLVACHHCIQNLKAELTPKNLDTLPINEAQVRPLTTLESKEQVKAWSMVLKKAKGGKITAELVEEVVSDLKGKPSKSNEASDNEGGEAKSGLKKLKTIAGLVEKALKADPEKLGVKKLARILIKIQKLLND